MVEVAATARSVVSASTMVRENTAFKPSGEAIGGRAVTVEELTVRR